MPSNTAFWLNSPILGRLAPRPIDLIEASRDLTPQPVHTPYRNLRGARRPNGWRSVLQVEAGSGGLGDTWFGGGVVVAGFSRELKAEAVRLMADEGLSAREVGPRLGINRQGHRSGRTRKET